MSSARHTSNSKRTQSEQLFLSPSSLSLSLSLRLSVCILFTSFCLSSFFVLSILKAATSAVKTFTFKRVSRRESVVKEVQISYSRLFYSLFHLDYHLPLVHTNCSSSSFGRRFSLSPFLLSVVYSTSEVAYLFSPSYLCRTFDFSLTTFLLLTLSMLLYEGNNVQSEFSFVK